MTVDDIIDGLGGATAIERLTGIPMTTAHSWKRKNRIPSWRVPALVEVARREGKADVADALDRLAAASQRAA